MNIPNPYAHSHYKRLAVIPLTLIAISLALIFFGPGLARGVDLKGGLLITASTTQIVSQQAFKDALAPYSSEVTVRSFAGPAGNGYEIELPLNENLQKGQDALVTLKQTESQLTTAELQYAYTQNPSNTSVTSIPGGATKADVDRLTTNVRNQAQQLLSTIGSTAALPADAHRAVELAESELNAAQTQNREKLLTALSSVVSPDKISFNEVGSSLSQFFFQKTQEVMVLSFLIAALVIFIVIRGTAASAAVIMGAVSDIIITLGAMSVLQIPLSLASFAGLLTLVGMSLDTDVLLTIRVLKRTESTAAQRAFEAMETGFLMNFTSIGAYGVLFLTGLMLQIATYQQIGAVVVIGSLADFVATWCANAVLVLWYAERKARQHAAL